jgi:hypothetical protein
MRRILQRLRHQATPSAVNSLRRYTQYFTFHAYARNASPLQVDGADPVLQNATWPGFSSVCPSPNHRSSLLRAATYSSSFMQSEFGRAARGVKSEFGLDGRGTLAQGLQSTHGS